MYILVYIKATIPTPELAKSLSWVKPHVDLKHSRSGIYGTGGSARSSGSDILRDAIVQCEKILINSVGLRRFESGTISGIRIYFQQGVAGRSQFCCQRRQLWILREADWDVNLCTCNSCLWWSSVETGLCWGFPFSQAVASHHEDRFHLEFSVSINCLSGWTNFLFYWFCTVTTLDRV